MGERGTLEGQRLQGGPLSCSCGPNTARRQGRQPLWAAARSGAQASVLARAAIRQKRLRSSEVQEADHGLQSSLTVMLRPSKASW